MRGRAACHTRLTIHQHGRYPMPSYSYHIQKADHVGDLHVHVYFNEGRSRKLLGRYRIPSLDPVFPNKEPELNESELKALGQWLAKPDQIRKLQDCLESTVFDIGRVAALVPALGNVVSEQGETYINVRIPVSRRLG